MDKRILVGVVVAVIIVAVAAVILLNPGDGNKDDKPAKTGYTITFDANGGSGTMAPVTGVSGTYTPPATCGFTAPEGCSFQGWGLSKAGSYSGTIEVESDMTLYAIWNDQKDMGIIAIPSYDGVLPTDSVAKAIKITFKSGDKTSSLDLETLNYAYYYGEATMTISVKDGSDWSSKTVQIEDYGNGTAFTFSYGGEKYTLTFAVKDGTSSGTTDPAPTYTFSTKEKAELFVNLSKAA